MENLNYSNLNEEKNYEIDPLSILGLGFSFTLLLTLFLFSRKGKSLFNPLDSLF